MPRKRTDAILDGLRSGARGDGDVTLGALLDEMGGRGAGALVTLPPVFGLSPLGLLPAVPSVVALVSLLFAVQIALGRRRLWLPARIRRIRLPSERLAQAADWLAPVTSRIERWFGRRLLALTRAPFRQVGAVGAAGMCILVPVSEFIPGAAVLPLSAILAYGLALTLRDGVLMLAATGFALAALSVPVGALVLAG